MEIEELKKQGKVFRTRMRSLVEAQLEMIGSDDWEHLLKTQIGETEDDLEFVD